MNQAVYQTYVEEALDHWLRGILGLADGEIWDYVVARVAIDYLSELRLADREVVVSCRLERVGTRSVTVRTAVRTAEGRLSAEAETVIVAVEGAERVSRPLSEVERAAFLAQDAVE